MAAPEGNEYWKLRSKHGRDKLFANPELLWESACEYFEWCEKNSLIEVDFKGKDAIKVEIPKMRTPTLEGLCLYIGCDTSYFRAFKAQNRKESKEFITVITRIEETIYNQQLTGAAANLLNPNIIARKLGLSDKQELDHTTKGERLNQGIDYSKLSDGALREIAAAGSKSDRSES